MSLDGSDGKITWRIAHVMRWLTVMSTNPRSATTTGNNRSKREHPLRC